MVAAKHTRGSLLRRTLRPVLSLLPFGKQNYLSLDIGSSSVKMLEVRGTGNEMRILNAGLASLPSNAIQGNIVQDTVAVTSAIRSLLDQHKVKGTDVVTVVPGPAVIIKRATFPTQDPATLEDTIFFEAGNFIPESLENVNLDYQVLDYDTEAESAEVLLVAVRKDVINSYISAIHEAGLSPAVVDVDYFALENMFEVNYTPGPDEIVALINIGARYSSINILKEGRSAFTGDVPVGGRYFTEMLAQELGVSYEQAEAAKIDNRTKVADQEGVTRVLTTASEQLLDEIQRALSFFWTGSAEEQISAIYLSGGTAQLPYLATSMSERLQIPVEVVNPFRRLNISRHIDEAFLHQHASSLAVSVGLATRRPGDK
jgi:type IV pilus assembly protein PilM